MSERRKKIYPEEFKESSVKLALESKNTIAQTARELGVNVNTLYTWIKERTDEVCSENGSGRIMIPNYEEIKRLKKELAEVKLERDLLKKATAYFAREYK